MIPPLHIPINDNGIKINRILLQKVLPPKPVQDAFNEVNTAEQEKERMQQGIPLHPEVLEWFKQICAEFSIEYRLG